MSFYDHQVTTIDGQTIDLSDYKGKTLLVVNVASKCGFTKQYAGLESLYQKYRDKGFVVLGFPCNQFAGQEPGSEEEIKKFCSLTYHVTFPLFSKINVNGDQAHPLYKYLKEKSKGIFGIGAIKWNFTKFLIDKNGQVIKRYAPADLPEELQSDIERIL